jgi:hypothetical protein
MGIVQAEDVTGDFDEHAGMEIERRLQIAHEDTVDQDTFRPPLPE